LNRQPARRCADGQAGNTFGTRAIYFAPRHHNFLPIARQPAALTQFLDAELPAVGQQRQRVERRQGRILPARRGVTELPSTPKIKQQSSVTNPHSETGHFHIKSMPKCGKFGAASTAGWGAGAAIFSPVGRVVLLQKGGSPPQTPPLEFGKTVVEFTPIE
jgi:hypothetical protein